MQAVLGGGAKDFQLSSRFGEASIRLVVKLVLPRPTAPDFGETTDAAAGSLKRPPGGRFFDI